MSAIFIDGHLVHYEVIGRGKPVLFLHGWIGSWRYWVPIMQSISPFNRAYAIDLWGFGESAKNKQYSINQQVELLHSFFEKIGLFQCSIVGHGLGGIIGLEFARAFPDFVDKLMLIAHPLSDHLLNRKLFEGDPNKLVEKFVKSSSDIDAMRNDELKNDPDAIKISIDEIFDDYFSKKQDPFDKTSLFVYGMNDLIVKLPEKELVDSHFTESHSIVFENTGHFVMLEESSKFSRLLSEFMELNEEDSPRNLQIKEKWQRRIR